MKKPKAHPVSKTPEPASTGNRSARTPAAAAPATHADPAARTRGGQPGNDNALKHGFYSAIFKDNERRLLSQVPLTDLSAEIELIRVTNKRFLEALAASKGELDFDTQLTALRAVNLSAHSIATLLRAHALTSIYDRTLAELQSLEDEEDPAPQP